jgi:hypothetical protein
MSTLATAVSRIEALNALPITTVPVPITLNGVPVAFNAIDMRVLSPNDIVNMTVGATTYVYVHQGA